MLNVGLKSKMISVLNDNALKLFGFKIIKSNKDFTVFNTLINIRKRGYIPGTIIDIGASDGRWSQMAFTIFPEPKYLLFEPLDENSSSIKKLLAKHDNWCYSNKVAGNKIEKIKFNLNPA